MGEGLTYDNLIEAVQLDELYVADLSCKRVKDVIDWPLKVDIEFRPGEPTIVEGAIVAYPKFVFQAISEKTEEETLRVEVVWRLVYTLEGRTVDDFDEGLIRQFFERNIPINVWPQARMMITFLTSEMGLPPFVLPVYKITR